MLRYTEIYNNVLHVPEVLYHWRVHSESAALNQAVKPYAYRAAQTALTEAMARRGLDATVDFLDASEATVSDWACKIKKLKSASLFLQETKPKLLREKCLRSDQRKSTYRNFEYYCN